MASGHHFMRCGAAVADERRATATFGIASEVIQKSEGGRMTEAKMARGKRAEKSPTRKRIGLNVRGSLMDVKRKMKSNNKMAASIKNGNFRIGLIITIALPS
ncbi:hypothetical protein LWI28_000935 [Acer negundo]|uniref:Uncharacterized protein n=1 Tax=Acer negundo TaxID=4023 RepID=A0AAD5JBU1_ACENE|nr:hypothetical protein LWI28_000935 [Acer negundo]